jgi:hypothetical protein
MGIQFLVPFLVPLALQGSTLYVRPHISGTERVGFSKQDTPKKPGSGLTTSDLSPTFLRDISLAKLRSTAWVRNPQGISKLMNKVDCRVPCALLKAIVQAFLAIKNKILCSGFFNVPLP